jgi:hypothetical protein
MLVNNNIHKLVIAAGSQFSLMFFVFGIATFWPVNYVTNLALKN